MYEKELLSILEASQNNALTFFVGAGVSSLSGASNWKELVNEFCDKLGREKKGKGENFSADEFLQIPQMYWSTYGNKSEYYEIIKNKLNLSSLYPNEIHYKILEMTPVSIITTNYDTLLEDAAIQNCQSYKIITSDEEVPSIYGDKYILKIHGDLAHKNIVLKEEDYLNYSENFKLTETLVKSIFATNTVVFIGYSLNDYNIKLILNWTKALLGSKFRKPIFIRSNNNILRDEELRYHESRGLSVIECKKIVPSETDYLALYLSVFNEMEKLSIDNIDGMTEDEAFDNLYTRLLPLDDIKALRINDVYRKLKPHVSFSVDGEIYTHGTGSLLLKKFFDISQMSDVDQAKLPKNIKEKYKCILSVFRKARIHRADALHKNLFDIDKVPFADSICIAFDYSVMRRFVARKYNKATYNYKKAFYLSRMKRYDEALCLFSEVARNAYKNSDFLLYYLAKSNCISLYKAIQNLQNIYGCYNQNEIDKNAPSNLETTSLFYRLPVEFRNKYEVFKDIYNTDMLYEYSYGAFIDSKNIQKAIESGSLEFGLTSSGKAICRIKEYLHFMHGNGIVADMFEEYKTAVRSLLSALMYKYSKCDKKVLHETLFPFRNGEEIVFDESDFYCFVECFKEKDISALFQKHDIQTLKFINIESIEAAVNSILAYYEYAEKTRKNTMEILMLQLQLKTCLVLLEHVEISQEMVDKICSFIFSHGFREISFSDKMTFLYSQLYCRKKYSIVTDKIIEDTFIAYLDQHISLLKNGADKEKHSDIPGGYHDLVHYISFKGKNQIKRKLSIRIAQIIDLRLLPMYKYIAWDYCNHITNAQRKRIIIWAKKEIKSDFNFNLITILIHYNGRLDNYEISILKSFLWDKIHKAKKERNLDVKYYPESNPYEELDQVGLWCFCEQVSSKAFAEFLGYSAFFDFFYEYNSFDFHRFDVSWLLGRFRKPILEKISKDNLVREKIREAIAVKIRTDRIDELDKQKLQDILIEYFC